MALCFVFMSVINLQGEVNAPSFPSGLAVTGMKTSRER